MSWSNSPPLSRRCNVPLPFSAAWPGVSNLVSASARSPADNVPRVLLTAAYGHLGDRKNAALALEIVNENRRQRGQIDLRAVTAFGWPFEDVAVRQRMFEELKLAGVLEGIVSVENNLVGRQLRPEEVKQLIVPGMIEGVVVGISRRDGTPFTWYVFSDLSADFHIDGQIHTTNQRFENDSVCNQRGCSEFFELSDAGKARWRHTHMIREQTGLVYFFTVVDNNEPAR